MNDSSFTAADPVDKAAPDFLGAADCTQPRRGFLIRVAKASMAVPAIAMMGASKPKYKPKQRSGQPIDAMDTSRNY